MDYGQPVNNPNQEPFFTAGSGKVLGNPDIDKSLNTDAYSLERDPRTMGNTAFSSANQEIFSQPPEATTEINGDLRAKPEYASSTSELAPRPIIDPSQVSVLGEVIESSPSANESVQNETGEFNADDIKIDGKLSDRAVRKIEEGLNRKLSSDRDTNYYYRNARNTVISGVGNAFGESANWKGNAA